MIESSKSLVKNTAVLYAAESANKIFLFVFIIYAARALGVEQFGKFSYSFTLYFLLQMLSDFGFGVYLTKEIAQKPEDRNRVFSVALYFRVAVTLLTLLFFSGYQHATDDSTDVKIFILIAGTGLALSAYAHNFVLMLRGMSMMKIDGFIRVMGTCTVTLLGLLGIRFGGGLPAIAVALFCGNLIMLALSLGINKKYKIVELDCSRTAVADFYGMAKKSLPFMTMVILVNIFTRVDTLMLQKMIGPVEVGLYHASSKVMEASLIFQTSVAAVLLPVLSGLMSARETDQTKKIVQAAIKYMAYIGIFITVITFMTADKLIEVLYFSSEYVNASAGLKVFSFITLILYVSTPAGYLLLSSPYANNVVRIQLVMVFLCIGLNLILIPNMGHVGAALTRFIVETFGLVFSLVLINRYLFVLNFLEDFKRPVIAGCITALFIYLVKSLLLIPCYILVYVSALYALRGISAKEFNFIRDLISEKLRKP